MCELQQILKLNTNKKVSGLFWVPGATAGIYGIQNAGLAVSVGTWSSIIVISSFCWGILVFRESVKSKLHALLAAFVLILGLIGMSYYSALVEKKGGTKDFVDMKGIDNDNGNEILVIGTGTPSSSPTVPIDDGKENMGGLNLNSHSYSSDVASPISHAHSTESLAESLAESFSDEENGDVELIPLTNTIKSSSKPASTVSRSIEFTGGKIIKRRKGYDQNKVGKEVSKSQDHHQDLSTERKNDMDQKEEELIHFCGRFSLTKRQAGLIGAVINGAWGSNAMIPMHYAR